MKINIGKMTLATFLQGGECLINGRELKARAKKQGLLMGGREVAKEVQDQLNAAKNSGLSAEARKAGVCICIPTEDRVWCLFWLGGIEKWCLSGFSLDNNFDDVSRLLRPHG